jgi:F420-0:gamma-glutamyl ligase-like protein
MIHVDTTDGVDVLTIVADAQNRYRVQDLVFACLAHNNVPVLVEAVEEQELRMHQAAKALMKLSVDLASTAPVSLAAVENTVAQALTYLTPLSIKPVEAEPPAARRRAISITE